jgi:hypothetical protein
MPADPDRAPKPPRGLRVGPPPIVALAIAALLIAIGTLGTGSAVAAEAPAGKAELLEPVCRMVDGAAAAHRLPAGFLTRILWQESRFRSDAISRAGAEGVAQFMPQTAAERGLADPRDPAPSIAEAARLLAELSRRLGNRGLAAAAYNAGPARVAKWLRRQSELPAETRLYVAAVTGRPAEDWAYRVGAEQIAPADDEPCLAIMTELARGAGGPSGSRRWRALDRALVRAVALLAAPPPPDTHPPDSRPPGSRPPGNRPLAAPLPAAEALCSSVRSLGLRCAVQQP